MAIDAEFATMAAEVQGAFAQTLSIRRVTLAAFTASTGKRAETVSTVSVALERGRTVDDFFNGVSRVKARFYTGVAADISTALSGVSPDREDYVVDTTLWRIVRREYLANNTLLRLHCEEWNGKG